MKNIWIKGPLTVNPYYETAFKILGISPDMTSPVQISQKIEERRQAVRNKPGFYKLGKRDLTLSDINSASQTLLNPTERILEEILEHKPEQLEIEEIKRLKSRLPEPDWHISSPRHLKCLLKIVQEFVMQYHKDLPSPEIILFPFELKPIAPCYSSKSS